MKSVGILVTALVSLNVFAGPEEHKEAQTCYALKAQEGVYVSAEVPLEICLETLEINPMTQQISAYSYFQPQLFANLTVTSLVRKNEDTYSFKASSLLLDRWESGCGEGHTVEMKISGETDFLGKGNPQALEVSVDEVTLNDVCHSHPQYEHFTYEAR